MLCSICQVNEATIHFKSVFEGKTFKLDLCEECARKKGLEFNPSEALSDFITTLSDLEDEVFSTKKNKKNIFCKSCGLSYETFKETGRLGCADCYYNFSSYLIPLLERIHGQSKHIGKNSKISYDTNEVENKGKKEEDNLLVLRKKLNEAIKAEQYELAAKLRDKIKQLSS